MSAGTPARDEEAGRAPVGDGGTALPVLLLRAAGRCAALPLANVVEVFRPLPIRGVDGTPPWLLGVALVRGAAVPVLHLGRLLEGRDGALTRFVSLGLGERVAVLAVEEVLGVRSLEQATVGALPPLLAPHAEQLVAIGRVDAELLVVLNTSRLVDEELWARLGADT